MLQGVPAERERSKQPGYVCTYDDYDSDDFEGTSYTQIVTEGSANRGYRTHGAHANRGTHQTPARRCPATIAPRATTSVPASPDSATNAVLGRPARSLRMPVSFLFFLPGNLRLHRDNQLYFTPACKTQRRLQQPIRHYCQCTLPDIPPGRETRR